MEKYKPPYTITDQTINLIAEISEIIGQNAEIIKSLLTPQSKRKNRIKTIQASLAIEQNSLTIDQVTAILDRKQVMGKIREIKEVENAFKAYKNLQIIDPLSKVNLLKTHGKMMEDLTDESGNFRSKNVGIFKGSTLIHLAPPPELVPELMDNLINWYKESELHPLVKSSIFHYEFEFIHPFTDGNGRMGRMWQSILLGNWKNFFFFLPVEELIKKRQSEYYNVLQKADNTADSSCFVEYILTIIRDSLLKFINGSKSFKSIELIS